MWPAGKIIIINFSIFLQNNIFWSLFVQNKMNLLPKNALWSLLHSKNHDFLFKNSKNHVFSLKNQKKMIFCRRRHNRLKLLHSKITIFYSKNQKITFFHSKIKKTWFVAAGGIIGWSFYVQKINIIWWLDHLYAWNRYADAFFHGLRL